MELPADCLVVTLHHRLCSWLSYPALAKNQRPSPRTALTSKGIGQILLSEIFAKPLSHKK